VALNPSCQISWQKEWPFAGEIEVVQVLIIRKADDFLHVYVFSAVVAFMGHHAFSSSGS
jgi:hypothetical protein